MGRYHLNIVWWVACLCWLVIPDGRAQILQAERRPQVIFYTFHEFMQAFNGKQEEVSVLRKFPKLMDLDRMKLVPLLFNPQDTVPAGEADRFAAYVSRWDRVIDMDSVTSVVDLTYTDAKGKPLVMTAYLQQEHRPEGIIWVLKDVRGPEVFVGVTAKVGLIGFSNNEVDFQEFGHNAGANPTDIAGLDYRPDPVTLFLYLTANKVIRFHHSANVRYLFSLGDYDVRVSHIINEDRPTMGWLITGLRYRGEVIYGAMD